MLQFSYLNVDIGGDIADPYYGFFSRSFNQPGVYNILDWEELAAAHPDKKFVLSTTSLARTIGTTESTAFNDQSRQYALAHNVSLFDLADIESHDANGLPCYDKAGLGYLAICKDYTTEIDGGHLGSVSAGRIRVAKAFWVLMAELSGWKP